MKLGLNIQTTQKLAQVLQLSLNPKILALLKTLQLSYPDLMEKINSEVEKNPLLEIEKQDELIEYAKQFLKSDIKTTADYDPLTPEKDIKGNSHSLAEFLMSQLNLENLDQTDLAIGNYLINNLDKQGYLPNYTQLKNEIMEKQNVKRTHVDKILKIIQDFEPEGVGARNLKECLLIQVEAYNFESTALKEIITLAIKDHLDDLAKKKYAKIAKALNIQEDGVISIANFIEKNLNPLPAKGYQTDQLAKNIIPSFIIEKKDDNNYQAINLEERKGPVLNLNPTYIKLLEDPKTDDETRIYLKEKLIAAKEFLDNIKMRHQSIQKTIDIITATQQDFFENGYFMLKPLEQKTLAAQVGVHPSTISRTVSTKFTQTPQGVFPLKTLCPRNFKGHSAIHIKGIIKSIIAEKPAASDQEICNILLSKDIEIKRRTVTKYRSELGFYSSYDRAAL
jgi:RNA polymerase sigma-54 factor